MVNKYNSNKSIKRKSVDEEVLSPQKRQRKISDQELWKDFNTMGKYGDSWVSGTAVKNYLIKDPLLDWLNLYYVEYGYNTNGTIVNKPAPIIMCEKQDRKYKIENREATSQLSLLFEMGNKFETIVVNELRSKYKGSVEKVVNNEYVTPQLMNKTFEFMKLGVPIIEQAALYNYTNYSYGVADLLIRSDWVNKLFSSKILEDDEVKIKASNLDGEYHYIVIDIKWTSLHLCANGVSIRNDGLFPAYKGQLAIYNAALGLLQGYTPNKAYILAKSWKYESKNQVYKGFNCFDLLGNIDYLTFDNDYIQETKKAIEWIRNVRTNGHNWSCNPPSIPELYPNMCNTYDAKYHNVKKELAQNLHELTEIWMVGVKHRNYAHKQGIFKWSDKKCNSKSLGFNGKKLSPVVNQILKINRSNKDIILPKKIVNNSFNWKKKSHQEFYVDFETINSTFYKRDINLTNSHEYSNMIFLIGVGYEEADKWVYKSFQMKNFSLEEEKRILEEFIDFINNKRIIDLSETATFYHWGNAEVAVFNAANVRHGTRWNNWAKSINWFDFCAVFQKEPIVIKGAKKFNLKEIAKVMHKHKLIHTTWAEQGPESGLSVMFDAANFYRFIDTYNVMDSNKKLEDENYQKYIAHINNFAKIIYYNEIDCKAVWDIVKYLRSNHV